MLLEKILIAISAERYAFTAHADDRLRERRIAGWQIVSGAEDATMLHERPDDAPNPTVELQQHLADGTPVKVVWAYVESHDIALLVTVHFFDR